jgi:hypothetical protein
MKDVIQTDVELKLRLAGISVVTLEEDRKLPGGPIVWVRVNLTDDAQAANIEVALRQDATLVRNDEPVYAVETWTTILLISRPTDSQRIRDVVKDLVDAFLNAWLSVNPKN